MNLRAMIAFAVAAATFTGCGDDETISAQEEATATAEIRESLDTALNALLSGDATTAYDMFSDRCQDALPIEGVEKVTETIAERNLPKAEILNLSANLTGPTRAIVSYEASVAGLSQEDEVWVYERNGWRTDGCEAIT